MANKLYLHFCFFIFCSLLSPILSLNLTVPSHGCYWNVTCQDRWWGDCAMGHSIFGRSNDCEGLCAEPKYSSCHAPYYTRFYCCIVESPKVITNGCTKCDSKVDNGEEYTCCTDCSDPQIVSEDPKLGYCKTGAEIIVEPKPKEIFKWVAGPWKPCSCDSGIRYRDVECYAVYKDTSVPDYPVYNYKCSAEMMPAREEPCNSRSCFELNGRDSDGSKHRMPTWTLTILISLGIVAIGGVGFAGYIQYKRRTSIQYGQVYVMMEGYV